MSLGDNPYVFGILRVWRMEIACTLITKEKVFFVMGRYDTGWVSKHVHCISDSPIQIFTILVTTPKINNLLLGVGPIILKISGTEAEIWRKSSIKKNHFTITWNMEIISPTLLLILTFTSRIRTFIIWCKIIKYVYCRYNYILWRNGNLVEDANSQNAKKLTVTN